MKLTQPQVDRYRHDGLVFLPGLFELREVAAGIQRQQIRTFGVGAESKLSHRAGSPMSRVLKE